jgi:hypothetical protein
MRSHGSGGPFSLPPIQQSTSLASEPIANCRNAYASALSSSSPLPFPSNLTLSSSLCRSLTFLGFFALTGPSALLSFHMPPYLYHGNCPSRPFASSTPPETLFQHAPGQTKCHCADSSIWQRTRMEWGVWQRVQGFGAISAQTEEEVVFCYGWD